MISILIELYKDYDIHYDVKDKILFIYKAMLVKDYVKLKNIIKYYELDIKDIRIIGGI